MHGRKRKGKHRGAMGKGAEAKIRARGTCERKHEENEAYITEEANNREIDCKGKNKRSEERWKKNRRRGKGSGEENTGFEIEKCTKSVEPNLWLVMFYKLKIKIYEFLFIWLLN